MRYILSFILIIIVSAGCSHFVKPNSKEHTALLMKLAIEQKDYDSFNSLFLEGRRGSISENEFTKLKEMTTAGADYKSYELVTFENGEMLLVRLTPPNKNKEIEIEDVVMVPSELKEFFSE